MPEHDLHEKEFDEATQTKLALYGGYVAAWLPTFLNYHKPLSRINLFDFFAGPGSDAGNHPGSPVIAIRKIRDALNGKRPSVIPSIHLYLNEWDAAKFARLRRLALPQDIQEHATLHFENRDFKELFGEWARIMERPASANLVFVDQYGIKQMSQETFVRLCRMPRTDILFFISTGMVIRFRDDPHFNEYLPLDQIDKAEMTPANALRLIVQGYRKWIPPELEDGYFLARFSLKKEHSPNIHGLVFGSGHLRGLEKFLNLCWKNDGLRGEANFDIDSEHTDYNTLSLFSEWEKPVKRREFERQLKQAILSGELRTNLQLVPYALQNGFLPSHAKEVVGAMIKSGELPPQRIPPISMDAWAKRNCIRLKTAKDRET